MKNISKAMFYLITACDQGIRSGESCVNVSGCWMEADKVKISWDKQMKSQYKAIGEQKKDPKGASIYSISIVGNTASSSRVRSNRN